MTGSGFFPLVLAGYIILLYFISHYKKPQHKTPVSYYVANRRFGLMISTMTLFATWFGAGTVIAVSNAVYEDGLQKALLIPVGAGLCLMIVSLFYAEPIWRAQICTIGDFYRRRFGRRVEVAYVLMSVTYFGWIAAQLVAAAEVLGAFTTLDHSWLIMGFGLIAIAYTVTGGLWAVSLTDAIQMVILIFGLGVMLFLFLTELDVSFSDIAPTKLSLIDPRHGVLDGVYVVFLGAFGTLAGNELMQRLAAAQSPRIARQSSMLAGWLYLIVGMVPVILALGATVLPLGDGDGDIIMRLVRMMGHAWLQVLIALSLISAVLSTMDSAILSVSSLISQNLLSGTSFNRTRLTELGRIRFIVAGVGIVCVSLALMGKDAYSWIHFSYAMSLCGAFIPLSFGLLTEIGDERSALVSIGIGALGWALDVAWTEAPFHIPFVTFICALVGYLVSANVFDRKEV